MPASTPESTWDGAGFFIDRRLRGPLAMLPDMFTLAQETAKTAAPESLSQLWTYLAVVAIPALLGGLGVGARQVWLGLNSIAGWAGVKANQIVEGHVNFLKVSEETMTKIATAQAKSDAVQTRLVDQQDKIITCMQTMSQRQEEHLKICRDSHAGLHPAH